MIDQVVVYFIILGAGILLGACLVTFGLRPGVVAGIGALLEFLAAYIFCWVRSKNS